MTKMERIDGFTDAVLAACEVRDARQERGEVAAGLNWRSQCDIHDDHSTPETALKCAELRRAAQAGYHLSTSVATAGLDYVLDHSADGSGVTAPLLAGTAALVRNLADGMRAGDWDGYAARHKLENVHRHLIDWSLEPGCSDARWRALKDARGIVTRAIIGMCR